MNPPLLTAEGLAGVIFLVLVVTIFLGATIATMSHRLIRSVCGLAICFLGVAGLYYFLNSPFVAFMEILIYVGAVCITIAFAIMLAEPDDQDISRQYKSLGFWIAAPCGGVFAFALGYVSLHGKWMAPAVKTNPGGLKDIGMSLLNQFSMVFELISIVLLIAIIGSLALAKVGRRKS